MRPLIHIPRRSLVIPDRAPRRLGCGTGLGSSGGAAAAPAPTPFDPVATFGADLWGAWLARDATESGGNLVSVPDLGGAHHLTPLDWAYARTGPVVSADQGYGGGPGIVFVRTGDGMGSRDDALNLPLHMACLVRWPTINPASDWQTLCQGNTYWGGALDCFKILSINSLGTTAWTNSNGAGPPINGLLDGSWHVVEMCVVMTDATHKLISVALDGSPMVSAVAGSDNPIVGGIMFGANRYADMQWSGAIIVKRAMTEQERADAVAWLGSM